MLKQIGQIAVITRDLSRATAFYRDILELPFLFEAPNLAFFQCGGVRLMLGPAEAGFEHASSILYFDVDDIDAAHRTLAGRGVTFRDGPHVIHQAGGKALWMAFFEDGEGNTFGIMQWK